MFGTLSTVGVALLALVPSAAAHMIMKSPVPYGGQGQPDSSPLGTFPCKGVVSPVQTENKWTVGEKIQLSFTGSAVHGGGSCQVSVTKDRTPTASSTWKVIYSIEGGCPGVNGPSTFDIPIPKELPDGEMSMAWTWFNHIGNREMYMNCAPVTVSGGSSSDDDFNKLPDMAVANVAPKADCKTPEGSDYVFENPGKYTTRIGSGPFAPLCGGAAVSGAPGAPTGGASAAPTGGNNGMYTPPASQAQQTSQAVATSAPAQGSSDPAGTSAPAQTSAPASSSKSCGSGMHMSTGGSAGSSAAPTNGSASVTLPASSVASAAPASSTGAASQPAATPIQSAQPSSSAPAGGSGSSCSSEGQIVCQGETQFGICNHGSVVWQAVAAGTKCQGNSIVKKRDFTHRAQRTAIF